MGLFSFLFNDRRRSAGSQRQPIDDMEKTAPIRSVPNDMDKTAPIRPATPDPSEDVSDATMMIPRVRTRSLPDEERTANDSPSAVHDDHAVIDLMDAISAAVQLKTSGKSTKPVESASTEDQISAAVHSNLQTPPIQPDLDELLPEKPDAALSAADEEPELDEDELEKTRLFSPHSAHSFHKIEPAANNADVIEESAPAEEPIVEEPEAEPAPVEEPVVEEPETEPAPVEEPVVEEPETEPAPVEEPVVEEPETEPAPFRLDEQAIQQAIESNFDDAIASIQHSAEDVPDDNDNLPEDPEEPVAPEEPAEPERVAVLPEEPEEWEEPVVSEKPAKPMRVANPIPESLWGSHMYTRWNGKPSIPTFDDECFRMVWKLKGTGKKRRLRAISECVKGQPVFIICNSNGSNCTVITEEGEEIGRLSEQDSAVYHNMIAGHPHNLYIKKIRASQFEKTTVKILVIVRAKQESLV